MLFGFIEGLPLEASILLIICFLAVCLFETINGFHDTANAVATVIYTKSLKPQYAVVLAGCLNFAGALTGGIAVAAGIIKLMPVDDLAYQPLGENIALVLAVLISAISWNLGTWYFGIPCSSSHTLIGSLLGGGLAFYSIHGGNGVDWEEAWKIGRSLFVSPLFGFSVAIGLMYVLRVMVKKKKAIFNEPDPQKAPPIWIRAILISTCSLVSFFHGRNDGQKGVSLMMVALLAFLPLKFALNPDMHPDDYKSKIQKIESTLTVAAASDNVHGEQLKALAGYCAKLNRTVDSTIWTDKAAVFNLRRAVKALNVGLEGAIDGGAIKGDVAKSVKQEVKGLKGSYEFPINWILLVISLCLGIGTMFGWKRIVVTVGEKIGKSHLTYAQGASAELVAAMTIGLATQFGWPVSTTHVLSSGIAGTMVAQGGVKNLQRKTIKNIALAWVLTLPVTMVLAALLYYLFRLFAG